MTLGSLLWLIGSVWLQSSLAFSTSQAPIPGGGRGHTAMTMFARTHLPYGLPFLMILLQKLDTGHSSKTVYQQLKTLTVTGRTPARGPSGTPMTAYKPWWGTMNSTEHSSLIRGRPWNVSGSNSADEQFNAFLFDLRHVLDYTFPCGHYQDEGSMNEWATLVLDVWLPCEYSNGTSNASQLLKWQLDHGAELYGELFGVSLAECNATGPTTSAADCAVSRRRRRILELDLQPNFDDQECKTDVLMPDDWKRVPALSWWSNRTETIGYRVVKLGLTTADELGLMDPRLFQWLGLYIYSRDGRDEADPQPWTDVLARYPAYLRVRTESERCQLGCGSRMLCRTKSHCSKECVQWDHTIENPSHYAYFGTSKQEEVAVKIVSPWLQRTGPNCKLRFQYRLHGMPKTELLVVLEHMPDETSNGVTESPMQLKMIPTKNSINSKWADEIVPIGAIRHPMRIRLEAWLNNQGRATNPVSYSADCYIDAISLIDCQEELYHHDSCQRGKSEKYRCELNKVCIEWDQLCDMKPDCFDGEDENDQLHNCTQVPMGARCNFEDGMCGWVNSSEGDFRWVRANASYQQVVERDLGHKDFTSDHTYNNASGHFMYAEHGQSDTIVRAYLTSPKFPRTSKAISDPASPYYNQCRIRFFFRHIGRDWHSLHLYVLTADGTNQRRLVWEADPAVPSVPERLDSPRWTRVSVVIPHQDWEYQLQFTALRMALYRGHFGIDDLSMTPQCFIEDGTTNDVRIAYVYNFTTCGTSGARGPNQTHCDVAYNNTAVRIKVIDDTVMRGYQTWRVPMTGEYRIVASGAAGGTLWGDDPAEAAQEYQVQNYGTEIEAVFNLTRNDQLLLVVGQRGESPCQAFKREPYKPFRFRTKATSVLNELCAPKWTNWKAEDNALVGTKARHRRLRRHHRRRFNRQASTLEKQRQFPGWSVELMELPGAGGGGATFISKVDVEDRRQDAHFYRPMLVAAGGGGAFVGSIHGNDDGSAGGNRLADENRLPYPGAAATWENMTISGGGGGLQYPTDPNTNKITGRHPSSGRSFSHNPLGGQCPRGGTYGNGVAETSPIPSWSFEGGFGGGGASCGPGGGGGGGFAGGAGGNFSHGQGGWSHIIHPNPIVRPSRNPGAGYIRIYPCLLPCPNGSLCHFVQSMQICRCPDGTTLDNHRTQCPALPTTAMGADGKTVSPQPALYSDNFLLFIVVIVALVAASVVAVVSYLVYRHKCGRNRKMDKYKRYNTGVIVGGGNVPMHQFPGGHNFHAEFNPNYEMFNSGALQELKEVPRQCVTLIKALGQGAFGEVYEGLLSECNGEANNLPIAVKSLPEFATEQAQMDFHMEALIMSKFNHPNIVRFIGVCFEKMPRFIILELLAGGDLKTFLRENRPKAGMSTKLTMADLLHMALDVAHGCQYLEENHFIHRDIAARNCLLTTKSEDRVVKIADFGMARDIYRADYYRKGGKAMLPVKWMPPEAFLDGIFTTKTDVWSFGVLLWEIFSLGYMPYPGRGNQEVMQLVTAGGRLEAPTGCPAQIYQIMTQCWHTIADQRPKFATIIERLGYCLQDPDVVNTPLPTLARSTVSASGADPLGMQSSMHSSCFAMTSPSAMSNLLTDSSQCSSGSGSNSGGTIKRSPYSMSNALCTSFHAPEPMPTQGTGVNTGVCPPYHPQSSDTFLPLHSTPKHSASSASECATDVLLVSSSTGDSSRVTVQPTILEEKAKTSQSLATLDDDVFVLHATTAATGPL